MAHKRGHKGSANDNPLVFGYNTKTYGNIVSQQIRLAKETQKIRKQQKETIAKQLATEIAKINALADDPKNFYTEEDRKGAIVAATKKIKSDVKGRGIPFTFDFSRIANQINKDTFGPSNINRVLKQEAKKKKQKYIN